MDKHTLQALSAAATQWQAPEVPKDIPHGDMPGDKVNISEDHIRRCGILFPVLLGKLNDLFSVGQRRAVVSVYGGSGVGKSETASLISFYLSQLGIGSYTLSGDNYPRRIPMYNDAERLSIFRHGGILGLIGRGVLTRDVLPALHEMQVRELDSDPAKTADFPWLTIYQAEGRKSLSQYLGTEKEQDFAAVNEILRAFKNGVNTLYLKRMGRTDTELWYDAVDFSHTDVLVLEWTHGNNACLTGIDLPLFLSSTPEETRAHRRSRNRDGKTDSPFTTMVLEIEQKLLDSQADRAALILSKQGELLTAIDYQRRLCA